MRSWKVEAPCDLLMVTSKRRYRYFPGGYAVAVIRIESIDRLTEDMLDEAMLEDMPDGEQYAWHIAGVWPIKPFEVKGKLSIYEVPVELDDLVMVPDEVSDDEMARTMFGWLRPITPSMPDTLEECARDGGFGILFGLWDPMGEAQDDARSDA